MEVIELSDFGENYLDMLFEMAKELHKEGSTGKEIFDTIDRAIAQGEYDNRATYDDEQKRDVRHIVTRIKQRLITELGISPEDI